MNKTLFDIQNLTSLKGSGDDYLSNEIFYRVAKMRTEQRPYLQTGHLHIPLIQEKIPDIYERGNETTKYLNPVIKELVNEIKSIIYKI